MENIIGPHSKIDKKSLIIGLLLGIILGVAVLIIVSLWITKIPSSVAKNNDLESKFISLDNQFNAEYKNIFTTSSEPSDKMLNDALGSIDKTKALLVDINSTVKEISDLSSQNMSSGRNKDWFAKVNQCYVKRQGIYSKYTDVVNAQSKLLRIVKSERTLSDSMQNLSELLIQFGGFAKTGDKQNGLLTIDKIQTALNDLRSNAQNMKTIVKFPSLDQWISYTDQLSTTMNNLKVRYATSGPDEKLTDSDYAILKNIYDIGTLGAKARTNYSSDVQDWVYNNRDSISKNVDREIVEANQLCNEAYNKYVELYPNSKK